MGKIADRLLSGWQPLKRATPIPKTPEQREYLVKDLEKHGFSREAILQQIAQAETNETWKNNIYTVTVVREPIKDGFNMVHLAIRRNDRKPLDDWRHKQKIKNQLLGPECEMVELFPAESRLVDTANSWHLWGSDDPSFRFPVGWDTTRTVIGEADPLTGAVQRPFEE